VLCDTVVAERIRKGRLLFGKKKDILRTGAQARAVITRVDDTGVTINNNPRIKLTLQVQPDGDLPFEVTKKMTVSRLSIPAIGTSIWVRYDVADKSKVEIDQAKNDEAGATAVPAEGPGAGAATLGTFPIAGATLTTRIDGGSAVIDARNVPGLRDELMKAVQDVQAGGNPTELRDAVMKAMSQGTAINMPTDAVTGGALTPPASAPDPLDQLSKLNDLRKSGALTEAEFQAQKAKLLGES
jgi:putative oligomerization/nucleic acid binding protein